MLLLSSLNIHEVFKHHWVQSFLKESELQTEAQEPSGLHTTPPPAPPPPAPAPPPHRMAILSRRWTLRCFPVFCVDVSDGTAPELAVSNQKELCG